MRKKIAKKNHLKPAKIRKLYKPIDSPECFLFYQPFDFERYEENLEGFYGS